MQQEVDYRTKCEEKNITDVRVNNRMKTYSVLEHNTLYVFYV